MSQTTLLEVEDQIQKFWSPMFMPELLETNILGSLVNRDYEGDLKEEGDTVKVSQIIRAKGETRTVGVDADKFNSEKMLTRQVEVKAEKRFVGSHKIADLVTLQSQIRNKDSEIRQSLVEAIQIQLNDYLYSLVAPSVVTSNTAAITSTIMKNQRVNAGKKKWSKMKGWYSLLGPDYYGDVMNETKLTSSDYVRDNAVEAGEIFTRRYGFNVGEDNSDGLASLSSDTKAGLFFHPDFLYLVMQQQPRFKISDLHANNEFGFVISVDMVGGAKIGLQGADKHFLVKGDA